MVQAASRAVEFHGITLVTGASGFIGKHLIAHLATAGARVRATGLAQPDTSHFDRLGVEFVPSDLTEPATLAGLFEDVERVFHLGAICNLSTPYERLYPINVLGVERITRFALDAGVRRFVHVGSTSVYGPYRGTPFREDTRRDPQDSYGRSKRDGEDVVWRRIDEGLPAVITRPCTVYGPGCNDGAGKVFSRRTSIPAVPGSGTQRLSNVRVEDVAAAVVHLSQIDDAIGKAFNIADDSHPTVEEALHVAARTFGVPPPRRHVPIAILEVFARIDGWIARRRKRIPDLEYDAVRYLDADYVVDNTALKATGYALLYPDFATSMRQMAESIQW